MRLVEIVCWKVFLRGRENKKGARWGAFSNVF